MRRLITMLTGALVLLVVGLSSMDAQAGTMYLAGQFNGGDWNNKWLEVTEKTVTINLTTNNNIFQINNDSNDGNNGFWAPKNSDKTFSSNVNVTESVDETYKVSDGVGNKFILNKGKYEVGVYWHTRNNCPKINVKKLSDTPDTPDTPKFWMYGQVNQGSWNADKQKEITNSTNITVTSSYEYRFRITAEGIANTNWGPSTANSDNRYDASNGGTFTCSNNPGDKYFALTEGSYNVQAVYDNGDVKLNVTKLSDPVIPEYDLYLFTDFNDKQNANNKFEKQDNGTYTLTYTNNKTSDAWFRLYDGDIFVPSGNSSNVTINSNGSYVHKVTNTGTNTQVKTFFFDKTGTYEFVATPVPNTNDRWQFTVKYKKEIQDMTFYLIKWKDNQGTNLGQFSAADENGIKSLTPTDEFEAGTYDLFVASEIPQNVTGWDNWKNNMYNNGSDLNVNPDKWENMQKSTNGTYKVTVGRKGAVEFYIDLSNKTSDDKGMKFMAVPPVAPEFDGYFLSGDLNGWMKAVSHGGDASGANTFEEMYPYKFTKCVAGDEQGDGWYKLPIVVTKQNKSGRMHGQFQILYKGDFHNDHWGHNNNRESDSNNYWNNTMSDDASNPTTMKMVTGNEVISNHHLAHNYYKDATIYFNPTTNQCYIDGTPQDIYVYYYNQHEPNPDNIKINMKSSGYTGVNYSVNPSLENAKFLKGTVGENGSMNGEEHEQLKALYGLEGDDPVLYAPVAPGLEESFWADRKEHYFNFGITGAKAVDERETFVFNGENIYFINYKLGSITLNLRDYNDNAMHVGQMYSEIASFDKNEYEDKPIIESIEVRLIALDGDKARYVTEETGGRTNDPKEALTYRFNMHLKHGSNQFAHDIEGEYAHLDHWNGLHSTQPSSTNGTKFTTIYDPSENWEDDAVKIPLQHSNRYVELEVKLTDLENHYHGTAPKVKPVYLSNFERKDNGDGTVTLTMKQNDPTAAQAVAYSNVAPNSTHFRFDGSHKYFTYKFDDPDVVTGVKDIEVEGNVEGNAEAVYYTLQGVKTDKPVKGQIYIVVRGNKSSKVVY